VLLIRTSLTLRQPLKQSTLLIINPLIKPSLFSKKSITLSKPRRRLTLSILRESRNLIRSALLLYNPKLLGVYLVVLETLNYNTIFKTTFLALRRLT
jgi:hypothetical protein